MTIKSEIATLATRLGLAAAHLEEVLRSEGLKLESLVEKELQKLTGETPVEVPVAPAAGATVGTEEVKAPANDAAASTEAAATSDETVKTEIQE